MLVYLQRCGTSRLLEDQESHDLEDGLLLRVFLWWEGERFERGLLDAAEQIGFDRRRAGVPLGVRSGQGVIDRTYRKRALLDQGGPGRPSEKLYRSYRAGRATPAPAARRAPAAVGALRSALGELLRRRDDLPDDLAESVTLLRRETSERFAEMSGTELAAELRVIANEMVGQQWSAEVQEALDGLVAALQ